MKFLLSVTLLVAAATSQAATVAAKVKTLEIKEVGPKVVFVKAFKTDKATEVLVGVPASILLGNACTAFVGQQDSTIRVRRQYYTYIQPIGSFDVTVDACAQVLPMPVDTTFTVALRLPKDIPAGDVTYYQDVLIGKKWVRVSYKPNEQGGTARELN